jgi:hypothetical protein
MQTVTHHIPTAGSGAHAPRRRSVLAPQTVTRTAAMLAHFGYTAEFARRQRQDRKFWAAVAGEMDSLPAAGDGTR